MKKCFRSNVLKAATLVSQNEIASIRTVPTDRHRPSGRRPRTSQERFIRTMFGTNRDYGKNVGGSNRPFFLPAVQCQSNPHPASRKRPSSALGVFVADQIPGNKKGGPKATFLEPKRQAYQRSRSAILPVLPSHSSASGSASFFSVMFGQISASSALISMKFSMPAGTSSSEKMA